MRPLNQGGRAEFSRLPHHLAGCAPHRLAVAVA